LIYMIHGRCVSFCVKYDKDLWNYANFVWHFLDAKPLPILICRFTGSVCVAAQISAHKRNHTARSHLFGSLMKKEDLIATRSRLGKKKGGRELECIGLRKETATHAFFIRLLTKGDKFCL
jgi:hypothetical protein